MVEITAKVRERALFFPQYAVKEEIMRTHYQDMLRMDIQEHESILSHRTLHSLMEAARQKGMKLEIQ